MLKISSKEGATINVYFFVMTLSSSNWIFKASLHALFHFGFNYFCKDSQNAKKMTGTSKIQKSKTIAK
jgi:hypothetical protein